MNLRQNKTLLFGGGLCLAVLLVELAWLLAAGFQYTSVRQEADRIGLMLSKLNDRNPFPSKENLGILEHNLDGLAFHVSELEGTLNRHPFPTRAVEAAELSAHVQTLVERLRVRAAEAGVVLPERQEGGFSRYASGGIIADQKYVPRLMRQLHAVGSLANILVDCGVASIDDMTRDAFEVNESTSRRRRAEAIPPAGAGSTGFAAASEVGAEGLYYVERIGISFTAEEEVVWQVMEALLASPRFMVVAQFSHRTQSDILDYSPESVKQGGETDDETLRFLHDGILRGEHALSRPERIITGNEQVQVRLLVDVYNFNPEGVR